MCICAVEYWPILVGTEPVVLTTEPVTPVSCLNTFRYRLSQTVMAVVYMYILRGEDFYMVVSE